MGASYYVHQPKKNLRQGSVLIITGASSGLGKQLALNYCTKNLRLIITGRDQKRLQETKLQCQKKGKSEIITFIGDINEDKICKELIDKVIYNFNRIDGIILNAGINAHFQFNQLRDTEIFEKIMKTNFYANVNLTKYALPYLRLSNGKIIVVSSLSGKFGLPSRTAYCASKFALTGFFQSLRTEEDKISIYLVYPTSLQTPMRLNNMSLNANKDKAHTNSKEKRQDPKKCAKFIVSSVDKGVQDIYIPLKGFLGIVLQPIFPNFIREKLKKAAKL